MNELELDARLRSLTERTAALSASPGAVARLHLEVDAEAAVHRVSPALPGATPVPAWVWLVGVLLVGLVAAVVGWARPAAAPSQPAVSQRPRCDCRLNTPGWPVAVPLAPGAKALKDGTPLSGPPELFAAWRTRAEAELSGCDPGSNRRRLQQLATEVCGEVQGSHRAEKQLREEDLTIAAEARRLGIPDAARRIGTPPEQPTRAEAYLTGFRPAFVAVAAKAGVPDLPLDCDPSAAPAPIPGTLASCQPGLHLRGSSGFIGGPNPKIAASASEPAQRQLDAFIWQLEWLRLKALYAEEEERETFETTPPAPQAAAAVVRQKIDNLCELFELERRSEQDDHEVSDEMLRRARHFHGVLRRLDPSANDAAPCAAKDGG